MDPPKLRGAADPESLVRMQSAVLRDGLPRVSRTLRGGGLLRQATDRAN